MKLLEITNEEEWDDTVSDAVRDIIKYSSEYERTNTFDQSCEYLLQQPEFTYSGKMYRTLVIDSHLVFEDPYQTLKRIMTQYSNNNSQKYFAWSKSIDGMLSAIGFNMDAGMYQDDRPDDAFCGFVLSQQGVAIDVDSVTEDWGGRWGGENEEELIAPLYNPSLEGFVSFITFFPVTEYDEFVQDVKSVLQDIESEK